MNKTTNLIALASLAVASFASASVTLTFDIGVLYDSTGSGAIGAGSQVAIFADNTGISANPTNSDLIDQTLTIGHTYGGNELVALMTTDGGGFARGASTFDLDGGLNATNDLAVYWFDGHTGGALTAGTTYGIYQNSSIQAGSGGTSSLTIPADGSNSNVFYYDTTTLGAAGATVAEFSATNTLDTIPEPSSTALLGLGSVALLLRRRR